jgi:putative transcriptional regulator
MAIIVNLDVMLAKRKMRSKDLAERIGITEQNVSLLKSGKVKGVRFETLDKICEVLECQPGDILEFRKEGERWPQASRPSTLISRGENRCAMA